MLAQVARTGTTPSLWVSVGLPIGIAVVGATAAVLVAWISSRSTKKIATMTSESTKDSAVLTMRATKDQWTRDRRGEAYLNLITLTFQLHFEVSGAAEPGTSARDVGEENWRLLHSRIRLYGSAEMVEKMGELMTARTLFYSAAGRWEDARAAPVRNTDFADARTEREQRANALEQLLREAEDLAHHEVS